MNKSRYIWSYIFLFLFFPMMTLPWIVRAQEERPIVVISPGHGWWDPVSQQIDPGASRADLVEKDINLEVARYVRDYLNRCPVDVHLTRNGDDPDHTLDDVDELVNTYDPSVGLSIHTNSSSGNPSGAEGWYTVGGFDDNDSQILAASLADQIASRLEIPDRGAKPETENRHGGLYIHDWDTPSALIEIAFLQGDAELLRTEKDEFGRSITQAILEYLDFDPHCADWSIPQGMFVSTYLPGDQKVNEINLLNDGLVEWQAQDYSLVNQGNGYGADAQYPLTQQTSVNEKATWNIPAVAPARPGIFRQEWQLTRSENEIGNPITVYLIVVPEEARQLKEDIDRRIEELRQRGEEEIERFIGQLEQEAIDWVKNELPTLICGQQLLLWTAAVVSIYLTKRIKP